MSLRTGQAYLSWIRRHARYHGLRHPADRGSGEVIGYLTHLAEERRVSRSTQAQAMSALVFLYREVLGKPLVDAPGAGACAGEASGGAVEGGGATRAGGARWRGIGASVWRVPSTDGSLELVTAVLERFGDARVLAGGPARCPTRVVFDVLARDCDGTRGPGGAREAAGPKRAVRLRCVAVALPRYGARWEDDG
jgi:hypothetical protein